LVVVLEQSEGGEGLRGVEGSFCLCRSVFVESRIDDRARVIPNPLCIEDSKD
jgi:hypothetical protein